MKADFRPLFLDAELAVRLKRIASRRHDASDANAQVAAEQDSYDIGRARLAGRRRVGTPETTLALSLSPLRLERGA